jgi:hypothetical protein
MHERRKGERLMETWFSFSACIGVFSRLFASGSFRRMNLMRTAIFFGPKMKKARLVIAPAVVR